MGFFSATYFGGGAVGTVATEGARSGQILIDLFVGDDYTGERVLPWTVEIPAGTTVAGSTCALKFVQCSGACTPFEIEFDGTIAAASAGYATLSFPLPKVETATITAGEYNFYVIWTGDAGEVITKVFNRQIVKWKAKAA